MANRFNTTVAPELKLAAQLILDTEKKLEKLQEQIDQLYKTGTPSPHLKPNGASGHGPIVLQRQHLISQQVKLTATTLDIVNDLKKNAHGKTQQDLEKLKAEWLIDMQPGEKGEDQNLRKSLRDMGRMRSELWKFAELPDPQLTDFDKNKSDTTERKPSVMDRARGLQQEYSYLDPKEPGNDMPAKDALGKDEGPDIEPGMN